MRHAAGRMLQMLPKKVPEVLPDAGHAVDADHVSIGRAAIRPGRRIGAGDEFTIADVPGPIRGIHHSAAGD